MTCILTVHGAELDIDGLLDGLRIEPFDSWRKGEPTSKVRPHKLKEHSGAIFRVSEADTGEHEQLIGDAIAFLEKNLADIQKMTSFPGVEEVNIDFGVHFKDTIIPMDYLPAGLVSLAGRAGVSICLSHYPFEGGRWEYKEDEENRAIEFHDSTLGSIRESDGKTIVRLDRAYIHESEGRPGSDAGTGWGQAIDIELDEATIEMSPNKLGVWISTGYMAVKHDNLLDLPCEIRGEIELYFLTAENEELRIKARGLRTVEVGEPEYIEEVE
jgi:hypothetical protein